MRDILDQLGRRWRALHAPVPPLPDPFVTLGLQQRLSRLSDELTTLGADRSHAFAGGFHVRAALMAYDRTLVEACHLAGLPVPEGDPATCRLLAEAALTQAGWTW